MNSRFLSWPLAELGFSYEAAVTEPWVQVLVDLPGNQKDYTYAVPQGMAVQEGDVVTVPFGSQTLGGIVIGRLSQLPQELEAHTIKELEGVVVQGFFSPRFWRLLHWVAEYYYADLIQVVRLALPPGLIAKSQRRVRLVVDKSLPAPESQFLSQPGREVLNLLWNSKTGDYSYRYLQHCVKRARQGIQELFKQGWAESYLELPQPPRAQQQKIVFLLAEVGIEPLTPKQQEIVNCLKQQGGELWLQDLKQKAQCSDSSLGALVRKGYIAISWQEKLRLSHQPPVVGDRPQVLTPQQELALGELLCQTGYHLSLLHGVTGSGKTEVYLQAIAPILKKGKSVLVLVPEIGLTPQLTDRFRARFGDRISVYHSGLGQGERYDTWRQMLLNHAQIVIGTRSAIFAPLPNLGLIILDEEHDSSFKQTQLAPTYDARTVAQRRAQLEECPLILGSATPSLESWVRAQDPSAGHTNHYLPLPQRVEKRPLPPIEIVDMRQELRRGNRSIFSQALQQALIDLSEKQQQGILFLNRRGHSTFVSCRSCGVVLNCPHCDVSLSYHYQQSGSVPLLRCHYCNYTQIHPQRCPQCQSSYLKFFGSGTQKVTQILTEQFPQLRWLRFDSDTTQRKGEHRRLLDAFKQGKADVLVGTQMLTKGLDLEQVTLVGVVAADSLLNFADYRSTERAFQTLTQVAGRAGRGAEPGRVIIQTYTPHHAVLGAVKNHDYQAFVDQELPQRQALNYPPQGQLILLRLTGPLAQAVEKTALAMAHYGQKQWGAGVEILGPAPASILRVADRFRWHLLLKFAPQHRPSLDTAQLHSLCLAGVHLAIDVDPVYID
jgi:primosomal protein N' (replication factor Y)